MSARLMKMQENALYFEWEKPENKGHKNVATGIAVFTFCLGQRCAAFHWHTLLSQEAIFTHTHSGSGKVRRYRAITNFIQVIHKQRSKQKSQSKQNKNEDRECTAHDKTNTQENWEPHFPWMRSIPRNVEATHSFPVLRVARVIQFQTRKDCFRIFTHTNTPYFLTLGIILDPMGPYFLSGQGLSHCPKSRSTFLTKFARRGVQPMIKGVS